MRNRRIILILSGSLYFGVLSAQQFDTKTNFIKKWDVGLTAGSTGVGIDVAVPVCDFMKIRAGASYMPHFTKDMHFGVSVGTDDPDLTPAENQAEQERRFNNLSQILGSMTGTKIDRNICMEGEPTMLQFKLLADIYPLKNDKRWRLSAGFFVGNHRVAKAYNTREDMPSLMSVTMYNYMYWTAYNEQAFFRYGNIEAELPPNLVQAFMAYGAMSYRIGEFKHDFYATQDMYYTHDVYDKENFDDEGRYILLHKKGDLQYRKGDLVYRQGEQYRMLPDDNMMVSAKALVNAFRPYLGIGYSGAISKDGRTRLSVDCGALFWGGKPKIITHDGVDMMNDLCNVNGQVGHYLDIISHFPVYPVVDIRLSKTL